MCFISSHLQVTLLHLLQLNIVNPSIETSMSVCEFSIIGGCPTVGIQHSENDDWACQTLAGIHHHCDYDIWAWGHMSMRRLSMYLLAQCSGVLMLTWHRDQGSLCSSGFVILSHADMSTGRIGIWSDLSLLLECKWFCTQLDYKPINV